MATDKMRVLSALFDGQPVHVDAGDLTIDTDEDGVRGWSAVIVAMIAQQVPSGAATVEIVTESGTFRGEATVEYRELASGGLVSSGYYLTGTGALESE